MNSNIKIAYIVLCHKNAGQINKMIKKLDSKNCDFFLHIDKKSSIEEDIIKNNHIFVLPNDKRIDVKWGDISMIDATVNLMESVFTSKIKYDYIWLISGQDFPLKSSQEIINFLEKNKGKNFIEINKFERENTIKKRYELYFPNWMRSKNFFVRCLKMGYINIALHLGTLLDRKNILNVDFYYGSKWWTLTYECAKEIYDILLKGEYIDYYKGSLVPDESIFQTIYMNSRFKDKYYDKLTYVNWKGQINHPKTFTIEDCDELEKVNYLMARKFDEDFDDKIINKLYDEL